MRDVFGFLFAFILGLVVSSVMDYRYVHRQIVQVAQCEAELSNPDHCIDYCEKAWSDFYGC